MIYQTRLGSSVRKAQNEDGVNVQGDVLSEGSAQTPYTWHLDSRGGTTDYSATAPRAWFDYFKGKKRISSAPFYTKNAITLPRQARDKNKGKLKKETLVRLFQSRNHRFDAAEAPLGAGWMVGLHVPFPGQVKTDSLFHF